MVGGSLLNFVRASKSYVNETLTLLKLPSGDGEECPEIGRQCQIFIVTAKNICLSEPTTPVEKGLTSP